MPSTASHHPRRRFRGFTVDGAAIGKPSKSKTTTVVIRMAPPRQAPAPKTVAVRDELEEKPTLTGPAEAYWPTDGYKVRPDGDDIQVLETSSPSGEEREVKRYPAQQFGFETVGDNHVIRRRGKSAADRAAAAEQMRQTRLATQAKIESMNARSRERWANLRGGQ